MNKDNKLSIYGRFTAALKIIFSGKPAYTGPDRRSKTRKAYEGPSKRKSDTGIWLLGIGGIILLITLLGLLMVTTISLVNSISMSRLEKFEQKQDRRRDYQKNNTYIRTALDEEGEVITTYQYPWEWVIIEWDHEGFYEVYYEVEIEEYLGPPYKSCKVGIPTKVTLETNQTALPICYWCDEFPDGRAVVKIRPIKYDCDNETDICEGDWQELFINGICQVTENQQMAARTMAPILKGMDKGVQNPFHSWDTSEKIFERRDKRKKMFKKWLDKRSQ